MSGGIVQLVATGAQDTWLTGKPEISFFRSNYKRYTHYALSSERQIIQGNPSAGSISTIRFEKKGDLLSYVYFIGKDTTGALIPGVDWSKVVDKIELLIGGQVVDTQDITWMTQVEPVTGAQNYSQRYLNNDLTGLTNVINGFLPLKFFFCKDWSVALPLVALQYHDVELRITWNSQLNYRVGYETYSVGVPTVSSFSGTAVATTGTTAATGTNVTATLAASAAQSGASTMTVTYTGNTGTLIVGMATASTVNGGTTVTITAISAVGVVTLTAGGTAFSVSTLGQNFGAVTFTQPGGTSFTAINITTAGVSGAIAVGQIVAGFNPTASTNFPVVSAVYPGGIVALTVTSATATNLDTLLSSKTLQFFPAGTIGVVSGTASAAASAGAGTVTFGTSSNATQTIPNSSLVGYSVIVVSGTNAQSTYFAGMVYVQTNTAGTAIQVSYNTTLSQPSTAVPTSSQIIFVKQVTAVSTLAVAQPQIDRGSLAILTIGTLYPAVTLAVGQEVVGLTYAGPATITNVLSATSIEVILPVSQTVATGSSTGAATLLQFIDPTPTGGQLLPAVTTTTTGFSGTYQQLQYEAWCSYLYLDGAEREYFASTPMDMLITQVNRVPINPLSTHEVNLAHPVKFLAFVSNSYATAYATQATTGISAASYQFKTQLNGVDVGDTRALFQWQDVPQYYHTPFGYKAATGTAPVAIISYCLDTSKLQPTGTLNFSRLDSYRIITPSNSTLALLAGGSSGYIYAVNYNILRIQKGMGSMLYSS
jgi:hypothetical protein